MSCCCRPGGRIRTRISTLIRFMDKSLKLPPLSTSLCVLLLSSRWPYTYTYFHFDPFYGQVTEIAPSLHQSLCLVAVVQVAVYVRHAGERHQGHQAGLAGRDLDATSDHAARSWLPNPHDRKMAPGFLFLVIDAHTAWVRFLLWLLQWCPGLLQPFRYWREKKFPLQTLPPPPHPNKKYK